MARIRPIFIASAALSVLCVAMWAVACDLTATHREAGEMALDRAGATAVTVIMALCWLWGTRQRSIDKRLARMEAEYQRREAVLIRTLGRFAGRTTGPVPRLRSVGEK